MNQSRYEKLRALAERSHFLEERNSARRAMRRMEVAEEAERKEQQRKMRASGFHCFIIWPVMVRKSSYINVVSS